MSDSWKTLSACAAVAATCIGGTYLFTRDTLKDELDRYKQAETWKLPELITRLGAVSAKLDQQLTDKVEIDRLKAFEAQHAKEFDTTKKAAETALKRLAAIEGDTVVLRNGETQPLGEPGLLISYTSSYGGETFRVAEKTFRLDLGQSANYESAAMLYTFTLKAEGREGMRDIKEIIVVRKPKSPPSK